MVFRSHMKSDFSYLLDTYIYIERLRPPAKPVSADAFFISDLIPEPPLSSGQLRYSS